jgi:hypothetical protein
MDWLRNGKIREHVLKPGNPVGLKCDQILPPYPIASTTTDVLALSYCNKRRAGTKLTETSHYECNKVIGPKSPQENYVCDASAGE